MNDKNNNNKINNEYKDIKIIGFDLDQTLYPKSEKIDTAIQEYIYYEIAKLKNCSYDKAKELFCKYYPKLSGSKTLIEIGFEKKTAKDIIQIALEKADIIEFLYEDKKLIKLINKLKKKYKTISLLTGSNKKQAKIKLKKIGLDIFDYEIFSDTIGCSKSNGTSYEKWLKYFQEKDKTLKPENFLYIGDRISTDVIIPNNYEIKAILVNVKKIDSKLEVEQLKTIHEIENLLL